MIETVAGVAIVLATLVLLVVARRRDTGGLPRRDFAVAIVVAVVAEIIGTVFQVSGVLLAVPVIAALGYVFLRSPWRLGDTAAMLLLLGIGMSGAALLDFAVHPNSGSQADQAAVALYTFGIVLTIVTLIVRAFRRAA